MLRKFVPYSVAILAIVFCSQAYGQGGFSEADANQDKKVDGNELQQYVSGKMPDFEHIKALFKELDSDKNGSISEDEFENRMTVIEKLMSVPPKTTLEKPNKNPRTTSRPASLKVGDAAPTFSLKSLDGKSETDLNSFKGKKPVVLIFGSYT